MVLGPLPALLQRPLSAARRPPRAAPDRRAGSGRLCGAVRVARPAPLRRRWRCGRRSGSRPRSAPGCAPDGLRSYSRSPSASAPLLAADSGRARAHRGAGGAVQPREPGLRPVRRPRRRGAVDRRRAPSRPRARARGDPPDRRPQPRLPGRRGRAVRVLRLHRGAAARRGASSGWSRASTGRLGSASSSTRSLALAALRHRHAAGRQRDRLGALFAGPVLALVLWPRGRWIVLAVSLPLLYWQLIAPRAGRHKAAGDPATEQAFYTPLLDELDRLAADIRTVPGRDPADQEPLGGRLRRRSSIRSPAAGCASSSPEDFELFTEGELRRGGLPRVAARSRVAYVAVSDSPPRLPRRGRGRADRLRADYLRPVWSNGDWRLYRVGGAGPLGVRRLGRRLVHAARAAPGDLRAVDQRQPLVGSESWRRLRGRARRAHRGRGLAPGTDPGRVRAQPRPVLSSSPNSSSSFARRLIGARGEGPRSSRPPRRRRSSRAGRRRTRPAAGSIASRSQASR